MVNFGKILIITDVHGRIKEMGDFFRYLIEEKHENIDFAIHLGDFWSGRNYIPEKGEQVRTEFHDLEYFDTLPFPVFHIRGNEDLTQDEAKWHLPNTWLMKNQESFHLNQWKVFPIDYQYPGEPGDTTPEHPDLSQEEGIDFILSHRPPYGLLDDTLHLATHKKLTLTGSPMVRHYYDTLRPALLLFGHFHYSNFQLTDNGLIVCFDKLIRVSPRQEFRYSYGLLDPFDQSLKVFWKNRLFFHYSMLERKMLEVHRFDRRNLYSRSRDSNK
ncbi:MAG: metallophosphoesterase family protein [Promethearchaeota archaeon]